MLLSHGRHIFPQKGPKAAIATWNLRRLGHGNCPKDPSVLKTVQRLNSVYVVNLVQILIQTLNPPPISTDSGCCAVLIWKVRSTDSVLKILLNKTSDISHGGLELPLVFYNH